MNMRVYSYPLREAAETAVFPVEEFVRNHPGELDLVERVFLIGRRLKYMTKLWAMCYPICNVGAV